MISRISAEFFRFCPLLRNESHDLTFMNVPPPLGLLFRGGCGMLGKVRATSEPSGITAFWGTSAPAPIMQLLPTTAPFRTIAPMPTSVLSPTVQLWRMALWPTVQPSPTCSGMPRSICSTQLS